MILALMRWAEGFVLAYVVGMALFVPRDLAWCLAVATCVAAGAALVWVRTTGVRGARLG